MRFLTCLLVLLSPLFLVAQTDIRGVITDGDQVLPGVYVELENTNIRGITDASGVYELYNVPNGSYKLVVSYIGYTNQLIDIEANGGTIVQDFILNEGNTLSEVVINARLEGQAQALNERKNRANITEIIAAKQIERFPDANVGDALKRMAGINVQYDQGEARFANIRGTAPELSSITINGERVPSAEAEKRFVQLDLIPADMVASVEVNKAVTPDLDGDAIGGSINLVTQKASGKQKISGTVGSGYLALAQKPIWKGKLKYSNRFANDKIGLILNASVLDKKVRSDNMEAEWEFRDENDKDNTLYTSDLQVRQYYVERLRQSYGATLDFQLNKNHNVYVNGNYNWRNDWENRYRLRYKSIKVDESGASKAEIRRQTKGGVKNNKYGRLEDQKMKALRIGGDHYFGKVKANWSVSALEANEKRPNERYISMRNKKVPITLDLNDIRRPMVSVADANDADLSSNYSLKEVSEENQFTEEKDRNARFDIQVPVLYGANKSYVKFGSKFKQKAKQRDNKFKEYEPTDEDAFVASALAQLQDQTHKNYSAGNYAIGNFVKREFLGDLNLAEGFENEDILEELAGNFNAKEKVFAAYAMYNQTIGEKFNFIVGARFENTAVNYAGKIFDGETLKDSGEKSDDYSNFLPGLHVNYKITPWTNVRAAWTNTLARPNYYDLVPYQEIDTEDNKIKIGNPALEATTSMNVDLMLEHFFKNVGVISAGVFYKDLSNVIADQTENDFNFQGNVYDKFSQPVNAGNASLLGLEFGVQRRLDFLPSVLKNLSFYANYTYNQSKLSNITLSGREKEVLPLAGTPKHLMNMSLAYDTKKFDVRLSYNTASAFIEEYGDEKFYDRWYDKVAYLDVNAQYKISSNWRMYFSLNNILDQPLRYYQGHVDRTMQVEYYGIQGKIGVKFKY